MNVPVAAKYVVITPVRDEEACLKFTVESVVRQTIRPTEYVIVDDGSKDATGEIIDEYAQRYSWIHGVHRKDRGFRKLGGGIIEAFYAGYDALTCHEWEFVAKLDGDLSFEPDYFERCLDHFRGKPRLGVGGGVLYHIESGVKRLERGPRFHVRGGAKFFRRACWEAIGGLWVGPGSDCLDEVKANMLGWSSLSFDELQVHHHRIAGSAYGLWGGTAKLGVASYVAGYHPLYMLAKCGARLFDRPAVLGSIAMLYGFVSCYLKRTSRVNDPDLVRYLRSQQLRRLTGRQTIWK